MQKKDSQAFDIVASFYLLAIKLSQIFRITCVEISTFTQYIRYLPILRRTCVEISKSSLRMPKQKYFVLLLLQPRILSRNLPKTNVHAADPNLLRQLAHTDIHFFGSSLLRLLLCIDQLEQAHPFNAIMSEQGKTGMQYIRMYTI